MAKWLDYTDAGIFISVKLKGTGMDSGMFYDYLISLCGGKGNSRRRIPDLIRRVGPAGEARYGTEGIRKVIERALSGDLQEDYRSFAMRKREKYYSRPTK